MRLGTVLVVPLLAVACDRGGGDGGSDKKSEKSGKSASMARETAVKEVKRNLAGIEMGSKNKYQQETDESGQGTGPFVHRFCPTTKAPVPADVPKKRTKLEKGAWDDPAWVCLKFAIDGAQGCQYSYESNQKSGADARYSVTIVCDPDGDGKLVKGVLKGKGKADGDAARESMEIEGE